MTRSTRRDFLQQSSRLLAGGALAGLHGCGSPEPQAEADDRPNLLFFFPDQHRPDWLGPGSGGLAALRTPNIDRLARDGVNFTNAL
ncbi:MAG: twin-arginine translocation signal domain-containing protein, partial [bacterium]|nr:twin-arginine translocation signal domain-containing protein [bacterium]